MARACGAVLLSALVLSCSHGAEHVLLEQFFGAARLRDKTALQAFATVSFEPQQQGTITTFTIVRVTPDEKTPFRAVESEIRIARLSVVDPSHPVDVKKYAGEMVAKDVTIQAPVRLPNGQTAQKTLNIILQRAILKGDREIVGRWIVTGIAVRDTQG
jgi:hypothetical protein